MAAIDALIAREILDSRGNPTVEVEVLLDDDSIARAAGWRIQGIDDRLAELGQPAPAEDSRAAPSP